MPLDSSHHCQLVLLVILLSFVLLVLLEDGLIDLKAHIILHFAGAFLNCGRNFVWLDMLDGLQEPVFLAFSLRNRCQYCALLHTSITYGLFEQVALTPHFIVLYKCWLSKLFVDVTLVYRFDFQPVFGSDQRIVKLQNEPLSIEALKLLLLLLNDPLYVLFPVIKDEVLPISEGQIL